MRERIEIMTDAARNLSDVTAALERAVIAHSEELHIDHDRMLAEFGCLWMLVRCRLRLKRLPRGEMRVQTWLRKPTAALSIRDFSLFDDAEEIGTAVQSWVLADARERKLVNLKTVAPLWSLPTPEPERTDSLRRLLLPETAHAADWCILPSEIDANGHLNNVAYVRHAEALAPTLCNALEVTFDRECFAGETLRLETAQTDSFYVRGVKDGGEESFRLRFWREDEP